MNTMSNPKWICQCLVNLQDLQTKGQNTTLHVSRVQRYVGYHFSSTMLTFAQIKWRGLSFCPPHFRNEIIGLLFQTPKVAIVFGMIHGFSDFPTGLKIWLTWTSCEMPRFSSWWPFLRFNVWIIFRETSFTQHFGGWGLDRSPPTGIPARCSRNFCRSFFRIQDVDVQKRCHPIYGLFIHQNFDSLHFGQKHKLGKVLNHFDQRKHEQFSANPNPKPLGKLQGLVEILKIRSGATPQWFFQIKTSHQTPNFQHKNLLRCWWIPKKR